MHTKLKDEVKVKSEIGTCIVGRPIDYTPEVKRLKLYFQPEFIFRFLNTVFMSNDIRLNIVTIICIKHY